MREPHFAVTPGVINDFVAADADTWRLIHNITIPNIADIGQEINGITIYAQIAVPPVETIQQYTDSFEIVAVPSSNAIDNPPQDYCAVAWLWGHGRTAAVATPFLAGNPWSDQGYQRVMTLTGYKTREWRIYARSGVTAGETGTGRLITQVEAFCNPKSDCEPYEQIHPWATVPPFVPGTLGAINGSVFGTGMALAPLQQVSLCPRFWTAIEYDAIIAPGTALYLHHIGGGPWRGSGLIYLDDVTAFVLSEYEEDPIGTYQYLNTCAIGALPAATRLVIPASYTDIWAYQECAINPMWARVLGAGAGIPNQNVRACPRVRWP